MTLISRRCLLYISLLLIVARPMMAQSQAAPQESADEVKRVAVVPLGNKDGTDGARERSAVALRKLLEKSGYKVIEGDSVRQAYEEIVGETPGMRDKLIVMRDRDLLKIGRKLKVDFVVAVNAVWHTKSIYVFPTLRTKATCTVDAMLIDVSQAVVEIDRKNVTRDSENKNTAAAVASAVTYLGAGVVSGGPKTPPQILAATKAMYAALEEFLTPKLERRKIDGDQAETAPGQRQ